MRTRRFISLTVVLGAFLLIPSAFWADDKKKAKDEQKVDEGIPKKQLAEQERADAASCQKERMPLLLHHFKEYERVSLTKYGDKPKQQVARKFSLGEYEKNFREMFNEIVNYDPDSKHADEARKWLKKFESMKKYGPTM
jgi:hypothetical protein